MHRRYCRKIPLTVMPNHHEHLLTNVKHACLLFIFHSAFFSPKATLFPRTESSHQLHLKISFVCSYAFATTRLSNGPIHHGLHEITCWTAGIADRWRPNKLRPWTIICIINNISHLIRLPLAMMNTTKMVVAAAQEIIIIIIIINMLRPPQSIRAVRMRRKVVLPSSRIACQTLIHASTTKVNTQI